MIYYKNITESNKRIVCKLRVPIKRTTINFNDRKKIKEIRKRSNFTVDKISGLENKGNCKHVNKRMYTKFL